MSTSPPARLQLSILPHWGNLDVMTRDFELIRKLLVFFDEKPDSHPVELPSIGGDYSEVQIKYHLVLMYESGFVNCEPIKSSTSDRTIRVIPFNLTWEGHE